MTGFGRFFLPGPAEVRPELLQAMLRPMIPHRSAECADLFVRLQPVLQDLFGTRQQVLLSASSATAMMEAGVRMLPKGRVLSLVNGAFSRRYALIAEACGYEVESYEVEWGAVHEPDAVAGRVRSGYAGVTLVHSETSTGALQPLDGIARAVGETPLLVDAVSSFAATPIDLDRKGLAFACSGSQKALALPPGLGFAVAAPGMLERAEPTSYYLDLARYEEKQPPFTPALPQLYALGIQLERIAAEGIQTRYRRHHSMAQRTWEWADAAGLEILADPGHRSPTVTCIRVPDPWTGPELAARIAQHGYTVGTGYGRMRESTLRIGHMGDQTIQTLDGLLEVCSEVLVR